MLFVFVSGINQPTSTLSPGQIIAEDKACELFVNIKPSSRISSTTLLRWEGGLPVCHWLCVLSIWDYGSLVHWTVELFHQ